MMYWFGIYTMVMIAWRLVAIVAANGAVKAEYTGATRVVGIILNLPMIWFVYNAWLMYR